MGGRRGAGPGGGLRDLGAAAGGEGTALGKGGRRRGCEGEATEFGAGGPGPREGRERAGRAPCRARVGRPGFFPAPFPAQPSVSDCRCGP